jgi:hypothetical protein
MDTYKPSELIFTPIPSPFDDLDFFVITPRAYFEENGCLYDQGFSCPEIDGIVAEEAESVFSSCDEEATDVVTKRLLEAGLAEEPRLHMAGMG